MGLGVQYKYGTAVAVRLLLVQIGISKLARSVVVRREFV